MINNRLICDVGEQPNPLDFLKEVYDLIEGKKEWEVVETNENDTLTMILKVNNRSQAIVIHTRTDFNYVEVLTINLTEIK